jgi:hypothetical protein
MIRVLVMANDSLLADGIMALLAAETDLDVVRLTRRQLGKGERYSVVIIVDENDPDSEAVNVADFIREDVTLLLIKMSLESRNIFVYESYQLNNPTVERMIDLVRNFGRANLKKKAEENASIWLWRKAMSLRCRTLNPVYYPEPAKVPNSFTGTVRMQVRE